MIPRSGPPTRGKHGLTRKQIESMRHQQRGLCPICLRELPRDANVDHDHALALLHGHPAATGCPRCVRALLCRDCNLLLGHARDSVDVLRSAVAYLTAFLERR